MSLSLGAALKLGTQQKLTPQMQHAIKLLAMSRVELLAEIRQKVQSNPLLSMDDFDDEQGDDSYEFDDEYDEPSTRQEMSVSDGADGLDDEPLPDSLDKLEALGFDDDATDADWGDICPDWQDCWQENDIESQIGKTQGNIGDHIRWQMNFKHLSDGDKVIAEHLIDAMDDDGFIRLSVNELHQALNTQALFYGYDAVEKDEILAVLAMIQSCEPLGVGARDLAECLRIQLNALPQSEAKTDAHTILNDYERLIAPTRKFKMSDERMAAAMALIRTLNPLPAADFSTPEDDYVPPDVIVSLNRDGILVRLNEKLLPKVGIENNYVKLIKKDDTSADNIYLKEQLADAKLFIRAINERNQNLLKVASHIAKTQEKFLIHGAAFMLPLTLKEVADAIGVHESTVSRLTTNKTMLTPQGVFDLKYFFSVAVEIDDGVTSSVAISAMIKQMIDEEDPEKPLSDNAINERLAKDGIIIARRTVAKYRENMGIETSSARKKRF